MKKFNREGFKTVVAKTETLGLPLSMLADVPEKFVHDLMSGHREWDFNDPRCARIYRVLQVRGWADEVFEKAGSYES